MTDLARRSASIEPANSDPMGELSQLQNRLGRLLDVWSWPSFFENGVPFVDIEETDGEYVIELDLPGVEKSDINIDLAGRRLVVTGVRKEKQRTGVLRRRSRPVGEFRHEIVLPGETDPDQVSAKFSDGVLTVHVAKTSTERPKRIKIGS